MTRIIGLDPSLSCTGWGVVEAEGNRIRHIANGQIKTDAKAPMASRLSHLASEIEAVLADHQPETAAAEEVFVNKNPQSTLKLGHARGVTLMCAGRFGIEVGEYSARFVKKAIVGTGGADKTQVQAMIAHLLPGAKIVGADAADALAVALTHAHHLASRSKGLTR